MMRGQDFTSNNGMIAYLSGFNNAVKFKTDGVGGIVRAILKRLNVNRLTTFIFMCILYLEQ